MQSRKKQESYESGIPQTQKKKMKIFPMFYNFSCFQTFLMPPVTEMPACTFSEQLFKSNFSPSEAMLLAILTRSVRSTGSYLLSKCWSRNLQLLGWAVLIYSIVFQVANLFQEKSPEKFQSQLHCIFPICENITQL